METLSSAQRRARTHANRQQYAAKARPTVTAPAGGRHDAHLRRITAQILEGLKSPSAIPSDVIMAGLRQAVKVGRENA